MREFQHGDKVRFQATGWAGSAKPSLTVEDAGLLLTLRDDEGTLYYAPGYAVEGVPTPTTTPAEKARYERIEAITQDNDALWFAHYGIHMNDPERAILAAILEDLLTHPSLGGKTPMGVFREEWEQRWPHNPVTGSLAASVFGATLKRLGIDPEESR